MTEQQLRDALLGQYGLRAQPEMLAYILEQMQRAPEASTIAILGADARTGVARREIINVEQIRRNVQERYPEY